ncbi:hypothetical protein ATANTOWER_023528 [Ataeniobius toweri]|uniref:Uncharacterized protein n=1 Tax=Ataeniobius toweri TaxID=208326 RepID=A0ABU7BD45_9TELE|nr:hypothetical protein [Ataeniobius toweri]
MTTLCVYGGYRLQSRVQTWLSEERTQSGPYISGRVQQDGVWCKQVIPAFNHLAENETKVRIQHQIWVKMLHTSWTWLNDYRFTVCDKTKRGSTLKKGSLYQLNQDWIILPHQACRFGTRLGFRKPLHCLWNLKNRNINDIIAS